MALIDKLRNSLYRFNISSNNIQTNNLFNNYIKHEISTRNDLNFEIPSLFIKRNFNYNLNDNKTNHCFILGDVNDEVGFNFSNIESCFNSKFGEDKRLWKFNYKNEHFYILHTLILDANKNPLMYYSYELKQFVGFDNYAYKIEKIILNCNTSLLNKPNTLIEKFIVKKVIPTFISLNINHFREENKFIIDYPNLKLEVRFKNMNDMKILETNYELITQDLNLNINNEQN